MGETLGENFGGELWGRTLGETTLCSKHPPTIRQPSGRKQELTFTTMPIESVETHSNIYIEEHYFENLGGHYRDNGCVPCIHGNSRCPPSQTLSFEAVKSVVSYIDNYAETNAMLLPG